MYFGKPCAKKTLLQPPIPAKVPEQSAIAAPVRRGLRCCSADFAWRGGDVFPMAALVQQPPGKGDPGGSLLTRCRGRAVSSHGELAAVGTQKCLAGFEWVAASCALADWFLMS